MSTRSTIAMKTDEGYLNIYCHFDGYPEHHAPVLKENYNTDEKVLELLELGDLSCLDENIGEKIDFNDSFTRKENKQCLSYYRDRGENAAMKNKCCIQAVDCQEYNYLFKDGKWFVSCDDFKNLKEI
ncbi:MAG: hypothetical protein D4S01_11440 [Dehalococcoidia bacterium]|nr:MAG: hypothetical protein D4S01_11440 [Dehalococcoidia bacterium]